MHPPNLRMQKRKLRNQKQQIDEKASPETVALTANYTVAMISSASVKAYEKADKTKLATSST